MNKKIIMAVLAGLVLSLTACKDFLDVTPPTGFTEEYVFTSADEIKAAMAGVYTLMTRDQLYGTRLVSAYNMNTDVEMSSVATDAVNGNGSDVACYDPKPYWTTLNETWERIYAAINQAHDILEGIERSALYAQADKTKPSAIMQMYGELKTLRAMLYLDAIRLWGDVIFRTHSSDYEEDLLVGVTDRHVILEYLIDDLIAVEPVMYPAEDLDYGVERASREFCQGLIGLLAMNRGGWALRPDTQNAANIGYMERGDNHEEYYDIAIEYLGRVIEEGKHDLKLSYERLWYETCNLRTPNDDDIIFSIPMLSGSSGQLGNHQGIPISNSLKKHPYGTAQGSVNLCGTYLFSFDNADLRRDVTCAPYTYDDNLNQVIRLEIARLPVGKWSKLKMENPPGTESQGSTGINHHWMRFADVLLLYAEAVNERFGPRDDARECLKRVRRRAFAPTDWSEKVEAYVNNLGAKDDFFQAIMDERKWEFGGEGVRKFDLARWNKFGETVYNLYNELITWGRVANGAYDPVVTEVPENIYWKNVPDPEHSGRTILEIEGIDQYEHEVPAGYTQLEYAARWYTLDNELEAYAPIMAIRWSFRGFINFNNASLVKPADPLRYLCPYPSQVITDHRGKIQNYYGFNY
ncbi:RagB/SusD family nutrient uptake outer membrane protein [Alistipes sp. OttesenSCG-928-L06]|nr:RagB/SusD family nutrient uptake outer membrane protein [Alistipes sp. OttesenSCG-928-L06]